MAGKVFFSVSMSLDGFIVPETMDWIYATPEQRDQDPKLARGMAQWMALQAWVFPQRFFRENTGFGPTGEEGRDNEILKATFERTGASIMGKRMFELGEHSWPENAPFHTPVFVLTHEKREPWERLGGTTFYFVNDGIESALDQARKVAGARDIRIAGGAATIVPYLNAGLIDEFSVAVSPVLFGVGTRLFEGIDASRVAVEPVRVESSPRVTHMSYQVKKR